MYQNVTSDNYNMDPRTLFIWIAFVKHLGFFLNVFLFLDSRLRVSGMRGVMGGRFIRRERNLTVDQPRTKVDRILAYLGLNPTVTTLERRTDNIRG